MALGKDSILRAAKAQKTAENAAPEGEVKFMEEEKKTPQEKAEKPKTEKKPRTRKPAAKKPAAAKEPAATKETAAEAAPAKTEETKKKGGFYTELPTYLL